MPGSLPLLNPQLQLLWLPAHMGLQFVPFNPGGTPILLSQQLPWNLVAPLTVTFVLAEYLDGTKPREELLRQVLENIQNSLLNCS